MFYNIHRDPDGTPVSVSAVLAGVHTPLVATRSNPGFHDIVAALEAPEPDPQEVKALFFPEEAMTRGFARVARILRGGADREVAAGIRVGRAGGVTVDGTPVDPVLSRAILRYWKDEESRDDLRPLVRFLRKVTQNTSPDVRAQLYTWLDHQQFSLASDGDIIGYKYVRSDLTSSWEGRETVRVDGVEHVGHIPHTVGAVVEMDRALVDDNPDRPCSVGLHVGTSEYVRGSGAVHLLVKVNPADVVSVPTDYSGQKMRCCRYEVVSETHRETKPSAMHVTNGQPSAGANEVVLQAPHPDLVLQFANIYPHGYIVDKDAVWTRLKQDFNETYRRTAAAVAKEHGAARLHWVPGDTPVEFTEVEEEALRRAVTLFGGSYDVEDAADPDGYDEDDYDEDEFDEEFDEDFSDGEDV